MMISAVHAILYTLIFLFLLTVVGNKCCGALLSITGMKDAVAGASAPAVPGNSAGNVSAHDQHAGRIIGWLERLIIAAGIIGESWEILVAVVALKTVARFKELDEQLSAEYFLIGSLFSIFWAILITSTWQAYDHRFGIDIRREAAIMMGLESTDQKDAPRDGKGAASKH